MPEDFLPGPPLSRQCRVERSVRAWGKSIFPDQWSLQGIYSNHICDEIQQ